MPTITVNADAASQIRLLARAWEVDEEVVVDRLLDAFVSPAASVAAPASPDETVPVHLDYAGVRTEGRFDVTTHAITIVSGPLAGRRFKSPSGAAVAVVRHHNPNVRPERNGWREWLIDDGGAPVQSLRYR